MLARDSRYGSRRNNRRRRTAAHAEALDRGQRQLDERGAGDRPKREARRFGHAVEVVAPRIDARAVAVAGFDELLERPLIGAADRQLAAR